MKPTRKLTRLAKRVGKQQVERGRERELLQAMIKEMNQAISADYRRNHWQRWHG